METAFLRGRDHQYIGRVEFEALHTAAIGLSRGGARKTYSYTDPNEDCVAFVLGDGGQLAIAADGHHGELGSEAAVAALLEAFASDWVSLQPVATDSEQWRAQAIDALMVSNRAILEVAGRNQLPPAPTTFIFALHRPDQDLLLHGSVGDSHIFAIESGIATELGGPDPDWKFTPFLGYEEARPELLHDYAKIGVQPASTLQAVVLATDGLSEPGIGVSDPASAAQMAVSQAALDAPEDRRALDACRQVVDTAMHAHRQQKAGDNIACGVLWMSA